MYTSLFKDHWFFCNQDFCGLARHVRVHLTCACLYRDSLSPAVHPQLNATNKGVHITFCNMLYSMHVSCTTDIYTMPAIIQMTEFNTQACISLSSVTLKYGCLRPKPPLLCAKKEAKDEGNDHEHFSRILLNYTPPPETADLSLIRCLRGTTTGSSLRKLSGALI